MQHYDLFKTEDKFAIAFKNEISLALMEDVLIAIGACIMNGDKDKTLKSLKELGRTIKGVLVKHKNEDTGKAGKAKELGLPLVLVSEFQEKYF